jgi:FkbM family methyltransferase
MFASVLVEPNPVNIEILKGTFSFSQHFISLCPFAAIGPDEDTDHEHKKNKKNTQKTNGKTILFYTNRDTQNPPGNEHGGRGWTSWEPKTESRPGINEITIPANTLDNILSLKKILVPLKKTKPFYRYPNKHIDLLKTDAEGFDLDVLKGASAALLRTDVVIFECHRFMLAKFGGPGHSQRDYTEFLTRPEYNFRVYKIGSKCLTRYDSIYYRREIYEDYVGWQNCMAIRKSSLLHMYLFTHPDSPYVINCKDVLRE